MEGWQKPETIALWFIIAFVFFAVLLGFIIQLLRTMFKKIVKTKMDEAKAKLEYQQNLLTATIQTQEKERQRIAADLHDTLIGKLTVLKLRVENMSQSEEIKKEIIESITVARRISHDLSPPLLEYTPLSELIEELIEPWKTHITIVPRFDVRNNEEHSNDFKIQLTRIIQETITNIMKHANATILDIHFRQSKYWLALKITDNGKGFDTQNNYKGLGLKNIETRLQYLKGQYRMRSKINEGTSFLFLFKNIEKINEQSIDHFLSKKKYTQ